MVTEVEMKRMLFGKEITQKSKSEMFSATDLVLAGNAWRIGHGYDLFNLKSWLKRKPVKEFIKALEDDGYTAIKRANARNKHTWVHPFLFIDLALSISPELKIEAYKWLYDELLKYRNSSGDSYKKMSGALFLNESNKSRFHVSIRKYASRIKEVCGVGDWNRATAEQLELRNKIHDNISLLCDVLKNNDDAVRIGIKKALEG
jgi:hypothetical protein